MLYQSLILVESEHRKRFLQEAEASRLLKQAKAGRPGPGARILPALGDTLITVGQKLKEQSAPVATLSGKQAV